LRRDRDAIDILRQKRRAPGEPGIAIRIDPATGLYE
jgi:trehalose/maltose hydrolase-like predicted phosphorylase